MDYKKSKLETKSLSEEEESNDESITEEDLNNNVRRILDDLRVLFESSKINLKFKTDLLKLSSILDNYSLKYFEDYDFSIIFQIISENDNIDVLNISFNCINNIISLSSSTECIRDSGFLENIQRKIHNVSDYKINELFFKFLYKCSKGDLRDNIISTFNLKYIYDIIIKNNGIVSIYHIKYLKLFWDECMRDINAFKAIFDLINASNQKSDVIIITISVLQDFCLSIYDKEVTQSVISQISKYFQSDNFQIIAKVSEAIGTIAINGVFPESFQMALIYDVLCSFPEQTTAKTFIWMCCVLCESECFVECLYKERIDELLLHRYQESSFFIKSCIIQVLARTLTHACFPYMNHIIESNILGIICEHISANSSNEDSVIICLNSLANFLSISIDIYEIIYYCIEKNISLERIESLIDDTDPDVNAPAQIIINFLKRNK